MRALAVGSFSNLVDIGFFLEAAPRPGEGSGTRALALGSFSMFLALIPARRARQTQAVVVSGFGVFGTFS